MDMLFNMLFISLVCIATTAQAITFSEQKRLYEHLKVNLDSRIRPVINQSNFIVVDIEVNLIAIQGLDEKKQLLHSTISLTCRWKYETLAWNESEFSGIKSINVPPEDAWIPDLIASNTVDSLFILTENRADMLQIWVESNGDATWYTGGNIRTSCSIDITKYPFDVQKCNITISKTTIDSEVQIVTSNNQVVRALYKDNGEWGLEEAIIIPRVFYGYVTFLDINMTLKRYSLFYVLNIITPVTLLSFMIVLSFKIPAASGERISYCIALLLTFVVLLNLVSDSMPRVPKHVSYLQLYTIFQLTIAVVITALSILLVRTLHCQDEVKIYGIMTFLNRCCSFKKWRETVRKCPDNVTAGHDDIDESCDRHNDTSIKDSHLEAKYDLTKWTQVVVHRVNEYLFILFMVMFALSTVVLMVLITVKN